MFCHTIINHCYFHQYVVDMNYLQEANRRLFLWSGCFWHKVKKNKIEIKTKFDTFHKNI